MPELLTVPEAAKLFRVSRSTAWRWCKEGTLTSAFKIGRTWRIHRAEVETLMGWDRAAVESDRGTTKKREANLQEAR
jgi:excisionase family DNA binding protein